MNRQTFALEEVRYRDQHYELSGWYDIAEPVSGPYELEPYIARYNWQLDTVRCSGDQTNIVDIIDSFVYDELVEQLLTQRGYRFDEHRDRWVPAAPEVTE